MLKAILNLLFPQKCARCKKINEILCEECVKRVDFPDISELNNIFAATNYADTTVKKTIWLLKYKKAKKAAKPLAQLLYHRVWDKVKTDNTIIIPIPLSKKRLRERGFNQAELLAKHLSENVKTDVLYKITHTESQVSIKDREKRLDNLKNSFAVKNPETIKGKNIILIDDVCTTGATIKEATKTLKEAGVKKVVAAVVARG